MMGRELTLKDIMRNPEKFGMPTFDEYCRNPDKYKIREDEILSVVSDGVDILRNAVVEQVYHIKGYKVKTLEKIESIAKDLGWEMTELDIKPELERTTGGKYVIHVYFVQKGQAREL
jgi:hypothetical protein